MFSELSHRSVNWIDGMKIAKKHFLEFENFTIDRVRDAIAVGLSNHSYGLFLLRAASPMKFLSVATTRSKSM